MCARWRMPSDTAPPISRASASISGRAIGRMRMPASSGWRDAQHGGAEPVARLVRVAMQVAEHGQRMREARHRRPWTGRCARRSPCCQARIRRHGSSSSRSIPLASVEANWRSLSVLAVHAIRVHDGRCNSASTLRASPTSCGPTSRSSCPRIEPRSQHAAVEHQGLAGLGESGHRHPDRVDVAAPVAPRDAETACAAESLHVRVRISGTRARGPAICASTSRRTSAGAAASQVRPMAVASIGIAAPMSGRQALRSWPRLVST